ncbi:uncharacterized protein G2W53_006396 [Senna tora]|uniref:Uncharacterized protein n=1 Tax=Senna tora TaxID=362788 RepID=A0A835CCZ7_9FABA|nr:uncharacterized protein G2W53_006396 [Senna tora]
MGIDDRTNNAPPLSSRDVRAGPSRVI